MASLISSAGMSIWQENDPVHLTNAAYGDIAASLVKVITTAAADPSADQLRRPRLKSVAPGPGRRQVPMRLLGGSLEKPSKEDGGGAPLEGALAVSVAPAAARHRSAAGPPAGFPTKKKSFS